MNWLHMGNKEGERRMMGGQGKNEAGKLKRNCLGGLRGSAVKFLMLFFGGGGGAWVIQFLSKHWKRLCTSFFTKRTTWECAGDIHLCSFPRTTPCQWGRKKCYPYLWVFAAQSGCSFWPVLLVCAKKMRNGKALVVNEHGEWWQKLTQWCKGCLKVSIKTLKTPPKSWSVFEWNGPRQPWHNYSGNFTTQMKSPLST